MKIILPLLALALNIKAEEVLQDEKDHNCPQKCAMPPLTVYCTETMTEIVEKTIMIPVTKTIEISCMTQTPECPEGKQGGGSPGDDMMGPGQRYGQDMGRPTDQGSSMSVDDGKGTKAVGNEGENDQWPWWRRRRFTTWPRRRFTSWRRRRFTTRFGWGRGRWVRRQETE